jgi:hypothetical protein
METSLDTKLEKIRRGKYKPADFIIADAKDADMGGGIFCTGAHLEDASRPRSYPKYLQAMREMVTSGLVDLMLMSASSAERLVEEGIFENSPVSPAVRYNDATDIWGLRHSVYQQYQSRNFRTLHLKRLIPLVDLGLYSITFSNAIEKDIESLEGLRQFLSELSGTGMRYFLEVFNPQIDIGISEDKLPEYINDCIVRCLAGLTKQDSPLFLKIPFNGPSAMEELCSYHPGELIVGVLGGGKGTIRDTFELVRQSEKYGARVALFGRKINLAESPVTLVSLMRSVIEGELSTLNAVKEYHSSLSKEGITPKLSFEKDQIVTEKVLFEDL